MSEQLSFLAEGPGSRPERVSKNRSVKPLAQMLYELLAKGGEWSLDDLCAALQLRGYRVVATSVSARIRELRRAPFNAYVTVRVVDGVYRYRVGCADGT